MPGLKGLSALSGLPGVFDGGFVFDFDLSLITFTPAMAIRAGTLFAGAPIIQGHFDGSGTPDVLGYSRGSQIVDEFYDNFDPYQGTFEVIWTPEKDRDATQTNDEYLFGYDSDLYLRYEHDNAQLTFGIGGQTCTATLTTVAGTTYFIAVRWDCNNPIDGTNYACITVNAADTFGVATKPNNAVPNGTGYIGSNAATTLPANWIIEGFTHYRRVLRGSTYGTVGAFDANGPVDELNEMYAG